MTNLDHNTIVAVIGAGTMGAGIAQVAANAGHQVLLFDNNPGAAQLGIDGLVSGLARQVTRDKMTQTALEQLIARITPCEAIEQLSSATLVIEAIVENLEIKQRLFGQLQTLCGEQAILATNTSSISVT